MTKDRTGRKPTAAELRRADQLQRLPLDQQRVHPAAVAADPSQLDHVNTYGSLPEFYIDLPFVCRGCGVRQIWMAHDQKWYFEEAKGHIDATAVHCHECRRARKQPTEPIHFFAPGDPYSEFSNFAPFGFEDEGFHWPTVEHYFQAQKFLGTALAAYRERIRAASSPDRAKDLGQTRDHPLRSDWNQVKEEVMRHALRLKFSRPVLRVLLLATGNRPLVEASPTDRYWGAGADGSGRNRMGALLSEIRTELRR